MGTGISGEGLMRTADALLRAFGQDEVKLLLPSTAMSGDAAGQLGLVDPGVQEVAISPVVARELTTGKTGPRRRIEFTLPASAIERELPSLGMGDPDDLFKAVLGLNYGNEVFYIENVAPQGYAGVNCLYVVTAVE